MLLDFELCSWNVITVCVTWRFTGRWRKCTWKERHAQEKAILCMFWYFDFSGNSFMEGYGVVKYYISLNSFVSVITYWYGGMFMSLTSVMISRNWGPVICFQFPWSGWNLYMLNFQLNNPVETAECIKCLIFFFNFYCISHSFT
jgi:lipid-A-disaccharide synthase-like uncharacterized protein